MMVTSVKIGELGRPGAKMEPTKNCQDPVVRRPSYSGQRFVIRPAAEQVVHGASATDLLWRSFLTGSQRSASPR